MLYVGRTRPRTEGRHDESGHELALFQRHPVWSKEEIVNGELALPRCAGDNSDGIENEKRTCRVRRRGRVANIPSNGRNVAYLPGTHHTGPFREGAAMLPDELVVGDPGVGHPGTYPDTVLHVNAGETADVSQRYQVSRRELPLPRENHDVGTSGDILRVFKAIHEVDGLFDRMRLVIITGFHMNPLCNPFYPVKPVYESLSSKTLFVLRSDLGREP